MAAPLSSSVEPRGIHRRTHFTVTPALLARFNAKVQQGGPDECWPWTGALRNGYGAIKHDGKVLGTHVVAFLIANNELPDGSLVTHDCDNRQCCNPKHLAAGTATTNSREMWDRREVNATRGEKHPHAVLTAEVVTLIRSLNIVRGYGARRASRLLGLNEDTVRGCLEQKNWLHLAWPAREAAEATVAKFETAADASGSTRAPS